MLSGHTAQRHCLAPGIHARRRHCLRTRPAPEARSLPARQAARRRQDGDLLLRRLVGDRQQGRLPVRRPGACGQWLRRRHPDYRLYPAVRFPVFVEDGARAVRWTADHVGVEKVFVMGHSAGAQIASMLAANTSYLAAAGVNRLKLRGLIGLAGPYDFLPLKSARLIDIFGGANNLNIEAITFARMPLPPALLIHGTADTTVYPRNSENLAAAWRKAGAPVELKLYPDVGHVDVVATLSGLPSGRAPTRTDVLTWLDPR
ncbi:MAG: alpha/beta hydrolase fold domain-containing protein [Rhodospirillales bacterium]|nr:alpha/beta hydrolase fold domain-containing protein [Rhodospirillales bacterium]